MGNTNSSSAEKKELATRTDIPNFQPSSRQVLEESQHSKSLIGNFIFISIDILTQSIYLGEERPLPHIQNYLLGRLRRGSALSNLIQKNNMRNLME